MLNGRSIKVWGVLLLLATAACSTTTDPDVKPSRADVTISGSSTVPLRLIVSTDFYETINQLTGERGQVFNSSDTLTVETLPHVMSVQLSDLGSVVVDVSNPSETEATVRLQVAMDSGQTPYDQTAIMSQGGALRFVFSYYSPTF